MTVALAVTLMCHISRMAEQRSAFSMFASCFRGDGGTGVSLAAFQGVEPGSIPGHYKKEI